MPPRLLRRKRPRPEPARGPRADVLDRGDDPVQLLQDLKARRVDPDDLTPSQRRACLVVLADGSRTTAELASLFRRSRRVIQDDLRGIRREVGRRAQEWTPEEVLGQLLMASEKYAAKAYAMEDVALAWAIQRDRVKLLRELGVLGGGQPGVRITVEALGEGYERAREVLGRALDPRLTGRRPPQPGRPLLALPRVPPGQPRPRDLEASPRAPDGPPPDSDP